MVAGCAALSPGPTELAGRERLLAIESFRAFTAKQGQCPAALAASFRADLDSFWHRGRVEGEVRIKSPDSIHLTLLDPLGRPVLFAVAGQGEFTVINVPDARVYTGTMAAEKVAKFIPPDIAPSLYYLMIGRLAPGPLRITGVYPADDEGKVIIRFQRQGDEGTPGEVIFDLTGKRILSRKVFDHEGSELFRVGYSRFSAGPCPLPTALVIETGRGNISLSLSDLGPDRAEGDFTLSWPPMFKHILVK